MIAGLLVLTALLGAISVIDWRTQRIPDWLTAPLVASGLIWSYASASAFADHVIGLAVGYMSLAAFGAAYFRLRGREGLGLGDAKLFAGAGAWVGWQALPLVLLLAALGGLGYAAVSARVRGESEPRIAFGPWLSAALWLTWVVRWRQG